MNSVSERVFVLFSLKIKFSRHFANDDSSVERKIPQQNFDTPVQNLHNERDISSCFEESRAFLFSEVEEYLRDESGWLFDSIDDQNCFI